MLREAEPLLNRVAADEEVVILRRGREVPRLVPPARMRVPLPELTAFRAAIRLKGEPMSATVIKKRRKACF